MSDKSAKDLGASITPGEAAASVERVFDVDLQRLRVVCHAVWSGYAGVAGFAALVETISKGDRVTADTIFRLWGVR